MKLQLWGKFLFCIICSGILSLYAACPVLGQINIEEVKKLNQEVVKLYKKGEYSQAIPRALTVVKMTRLILGQNHPSVAVSLNNQAALYEKLENYVTAETLYLQSLKIFKVSERLDHPLFAKTLSHLISLYKKTGYRTIAATLDKQSKEIRAKFINPEPSNIKASISKGKEFDKEHSNISKMKNVFIRGPKLPNR
jgi:tetratricopeptide (TPR) repeat protein